MCHRNIIYRTDELTVVANYVSKRKRVSSYQSEKDLEKEFIQILKSQCYEYLPIHNENDLIKNLRIKLEELNKYEFTDNEWECFFKNKIVGRDEEVVDKTKKIQEDYVQLLECDNGQTKNIKLIDKKCIHNNKLQVINQYAEDKGKYKTRYDVTILINGLPLVHVELKRRGVCLKEAFNQIKRYQRDSFCASNGLFDFIQIFVISNGTDTKYYSNTTRSNHVKEVNNNKVGKSSTFKSFEFTSYWTDAKNNIIYDLVDFAETFFAKHTILNIITKYCVFTVDKELLVMRPYQICATEKIINKINISNNYKTYGSIKAGGYIWHTTGSGKTLTSFKTSQQIVKELSYIDKVLFVVDRRDLDYQTMCEYDKYQKGAANSNTSTKILKKQLDSSNDDKKLIVTTIQKLARFIAKNKDHLIYDKHVVFIFDECHRSQFGEMHKKIIKHFKKYHLFGFTGTPIFNTLKKNELILKTTDQIFGDKLHTYNIVDARKANNVLPFKIEYIKTCNIKPDIKDEKVFDINRKKVWLDKSRISNIVKYILDNFHKKTCVNKVEYSINVVDNINKVVSSRDRKNNVATYTEKKLNGFNSMLCVSSIEAAKKYYSEFKKQMNLNSSKNLIVVAIFSYSNNEDEEENLESTSGLDKASRDFLEKVIQDYNKIFRTNYDTSSNDKFQNYYRDVSHRMKNREIDILIVVNMFLTGFDAKTLNTLWVDKNLKDHGLVQAFSRTNRILNSVKQYGNIVCFRPLQKQVDKALAIFGDSKDKRICRIRTFHEYFFGYTSHDGKKIPGYKNLIDQIKYKYPLTFRNKWKIGEQAEKDFIKLFGKNT